MSTLYHYTDVNGFFEIISKQKLWLSSTRNLNDHGELSWGMKLVYAAIREFELLNEAEKKLLIDQFTAMCGFDRFICSLSEAPDSLSQWRAYADDGHGFAIGFDSDAFPNYPFPDVNAGTAESATTLHKVLYVKDEQEVAVHTTLTELASELDAADEDRKAILFSFAGSKLAGLTVIFKNPAFDEEKEWRLVYAPPISTAMFNGVRRITPGPDLVKQRVSKKRICTYFERSFLPEEIVSIVEGPKCQVHFIDLQILLIDNGINLNSSRSKATYR